ncbi:hypothetical protein BH11BAC1_BH11BAC1_21270 [soil metagenome]
MKKTSSILLIVLVSISFCTAQTKTGRTTEEEFNYMTKGYKMQLDGGLDMKKGYITDEPQVLVEGNYTFKFIPLARVSGIDSTLIGYIVKAHSSVSGSNYWYGIPFGDEQLLDRCFGAIEYLDLSMTQAFFKAYVKFETMEEED